MARLLFGVLGFPVMISPPFLIGLAWYKLVHKNESISRWNYRVILSWASLILVSGLLIASVIAFLNYRCNADLGDWSCVIRWRRFAAILVRITPVAFLLSFLGCKGTRVLTALAALGIAYDCVLVDAMA